MAHTNLTEFVDRILTITPASIDSRAAVLSQLIMMAAGHFVGESLQWDEQKGMWEGSRQYLRDTNLDVITAEAIVWITFLMGEFWRAEQKKDREMFERIGYVTVSTAGRLALQTIESKTAFDFTARATESRKLYLDRKILADIAVKDAAAFMFVEPFASVLLRSVGCQSLAEPPKTPIGPLPPLEWTPINIAVSIFFSSIPSGFYDTFKNMLREWSDRFPHEAEDFDDSRFTRFQCWNYATS